MRKRARSLFALLLALAALFTYAVPAGAYSEALGEELQKTDTPIHQETMLSTNVFWSSYYDNFRTENFITYKPNGNVRPIVTYGDVLTDVSTMSRAARYLENSGYRVVCGINGDFFNTSNGLPVGLIVTDGKLRSSDSGYYAMGFYSDGSAILGKPALKVHADFGYMIYEESGYGTEVVRDIAAVNKARVSTGGIYLFTRDFNASHTTGNTEAGIDAVCTITSGSLEIGGTLKMRVDRLMQTSRPTAIGQNQVVLSVNLKSDEYWQKAFKNLPLGSEITVTVTASDPRWNNVEQGLGALYLLAENGQIVNKTQTTQGPRTAVGQKPDGTLIFYTIDGRLKGHSVGATLYQTAQRLIELGCATVLGLDGGGSTTISVTMPDAERAATINIPSEGAERAVSNKIFLVASPKPSGNLDHFYLRPDYPLVLAGSPVRFSVSGVDTNYCPMEAPYTLSASAGTIQGNVLTTPQNGGAVTVTASGRGKSGSVVVEAIASPDALAVRDADGNALTELKLTPGVSVQLSASASYRHLKLYAEDSAFRWSSASASGDITANGLYTAMVPGSDTITLTCGGRSMSLPVTISKVRLIEMENFEETPSGKGDGAALVSVVGGEFARYGRGAGELHYDLTGVTPVVADENSTRMNVDAQQDAQLFGGEPLPGETTPAPDNTYHAEEVPPSLPDLPDWESASPDESGPGMGASETQADIAEPTQPAQPVTVEPTQPAQPVTVEPSQPAQPVTVEPTQPAQPVTEVIPAPITPEPPVNAPDVQEGVPEGPSWEAQEVQEGTSVENWEGMNPTAYGRCEWEDDLSWTNALAADSGDDDENLYGAGADAGRYSGGNVEESLYGDSATSGHTYADSPDAATEPPVEDNAPLADGGAQWRYTNPIAMPGLPYNALSMWVKGDGSENQLLLLCRDRNGAETRVPVASLNFADWRQVTVPLSNPSCLISGFAVTAPTPRADNPVVTQTSRTGVIYLDQMVATYNDTTDRTPPTVSLSRSYNIIRATVKDELDGVLPWNAITASVNGERVVSAYDADKGTVIITLPEAGATQEPVRVTVTARDASGNIGRDSVDIEPYNVPNRFNDIEGCWAADYINFLYRRNIAEPYADGSYRPYEIITRAEFAVMLARAIGLDGRVYADVQLPYADLAQIPAKALPALKALYAENIMRGAQGVDGRLYLMPNSGLTRAHASAMIGRSQPLGYGSAELPFPDAASIPSYAVPHIRTMVARGILQGYSDGYFHSENNISRGQMAKILYFLA